MNKYKVMFRMNGAIRYIRPVPAALNSFDAIEMARATISEPDWDKNMDISVTLEDSKND